jgi:hypothetical protein
MILKKLKRTSFTKPKATMIGNLVDYILAAKDDSEREKTVYAAARNFLSRTPAGWKAEMTSLASESIQSKMPVTHWSLSWQENEQPSHERIEEAVTVFLERMGLEGHQVIYALHGNTANPHLHIAVNRTHPDTLKVIQPHKGFDIEEAHRIVALLERKQGWASESNPRYMINDQGEIVRRPQKVVLKPRDKAATAESATGEKSAQRIAQERGHAVIENAQSWKELHEGLAKAGLRFAKKGSGGVVFVGEFAVKASSIDRNFGLSKLCKRLGDFEPENYEPEMKTPEPEPVSDIASEEWREYRQLREHAAVQRLKENRLAVAVMFQASDSQREHRESSLARLARYGLPMLNIARHFLKEQQTSELRRLRGEMPKREKPLPRFWKWLGERNPRKASLWKFRRRFPPGAEIPKREFPRISAMQSPYPAYRGLVLKKVPEPMDDSRRDAMTALWMRAAGYTVYEVADEMFKKARPLRKDTERRDWKSYARRTAQYAFGASGDIDIANAGLTPEKILSFHQEAETLDAARAAKEREKAVEEQRPVFRMR